MRDVGAWVGLTERCNFLHILDKGVVVARFGILVKMTAIAVP